MLLRLNCARSVCCRARGGSGGGCSSRLSSTLTVSAWSTSTRLVMSSVTAPQCPLLASAVELSRSANCPSLSASLSGSSCSLSRKACHEIQYFLHSARCSSVPSNCHRVSVASQSLSLRQLQRTLKSTFVMSENPSSTLGSRYLDAKPVNAIFGSIVRFSGFIYCLISFTREPGTFTRPIARSEESSQSLQSTP